MRSQRSSGCFTEACHYVHYSIWEACLLNQFPQPQSGQRGLLSGLKYTRATHGERRREFPSGHDKWEIPWDDLPNNPDRFAQGISEVFGMGRRKRNGCAFDFRGPASHITKYVHYGRDINDAREEERLTVIQGLEFCEFLVVLLDQIGQFPQKTPALCRRHLRPQPGFKCLSCCGHSFVNVSAIALRHLR